MEDVNAVSLTVDGLDYFGWKSVEITAGLEDQARSFTLNITWKWPGQPLPLPIKQGAKCQVRIGDDLVLTGWVFATPISYDHQQITTSVSGRSLAADLVDCAAINKPGQWNNQSVLSIVRALSAPYGVRVRSEIPEGAKLSDHTIEPGETVFESIDRLLTLFRVFSTDDAKGMAVLAKPGSEVRAFDALEVGNNILTGDAALDFSAVFSEYQVLGQKSGTDDEFGEQAAEVSAVVADPRVGRKRVMIIQESGQMTNELAQARANWERGTRMGKALTTNYTVQGWRQSNGALWKHNSLVRVIDPIVGFDRIMLIARVTYTLTDSGQITKLEVGPPDGFEPEPHDPHKDRKLKKGGKADNFEYLIPADYEPKKMSLKSMMARGTVVLAAAGKMMQTLQVRLTAGELKDNVEHFEPYGLTSNPHPGAEVLTMFLGGDRSHAVVVVAADRRYRITALEPGEVAIYTDEGDKIHFKRGRIIDIETATLNIKATTAVNFDTPVINQTGEIVSTGDQVAGGVSQILHVHTNVQAGNGNSGPPAAGA